MTEDNLMNLDELTLPVLALRNIVLMPELKITLDVQREQSKEAVETAVEDDLFLAVFSQKDGDDELPSYHDLEKIGSLAKVEQVIEVNNTGILRVTLQGLRRIQLTDEVLDFYENRPLSDFDYSDVPNIQLLREEPMSPSELMHVAAKRRVLEDLFRTYSLESNRQSPESLTQFEAEKDDGRFVDRVAGQILTDAEDRQNYLNLTDLQERLDTLLERLAVNINLNRLEKEIEAKVRVNVDKNQRDYFLREQIRVISEELGDDASPDRVIEEYEEKLEAIDLEDKYKEKILKEIHKLSLYPSQSPEIGLTRSYLDTIFDLSWGKIRPVNYNIDRIEKALNKDHYALYDVKERILEFIAVQKLRAEKGEKESKGPILCLVGPPGVGKTSIAASIAKAMGRDYVRMSLGGVTDEAEIRGHRKTYIGAMPGRIINALIQAGSDNPLILMDEIDKLSSDYKGDPTSALLEVLDPEQNNNFRDHYLEVPYDLSQVLFITTANRRDLIPQPLLDRMEIIELNGYTLIEKYQIARRHLLPKQLEENALTSKDLTVYKSAILDLINNYTAEAGVRQLERVLGKVCRKAALEIAGKKDRGEAVEKITVTKDNLIDYAGKPKYFYDKVGRQARVGLVRGLAWTAAGGDTLEIEAQVMPGKGRLNITGQLGDVMQESCQVALAYVRSLSDQFKIEEDYFDKHDIHVHVPAGAVPKDGPSAGVTLTTAILSAITKTKVNADLAMTGEITLSGRVLPIGGLKEKLIAADRAGIKKVFIPEENGRDLDEVAPEVLDRLEVIKVSSGQELLDHIFK
jgi:ATP-dependent Lon protease